jgi:Type III restriction enzyme, res subunit
LRISYFSAPCGSGKTYQLIEEACKRVNKWQRKVIFAQPTTQLLENTIRTVEQRLDLSQFRKFFGSSPGRSVAKELVDYLKTPAPCWRDNTRRLSENFSRRSKLNHWRMKRVFSTTSRRPQQSLTYRKLDVGGVTISVEERRLRPSIIWFRI